MLTMNFSTSRGVLLGRALKADPAKYAEHRQADRAYQNAMNARKRGEVVDQGHLDVIKTKRRVTKDAAVKASPMRHRAYLEACEAHYREEKAAGVYDTPERKARLYAAHKRWRQNNESAMIGFRLRNRLNELLRNQGADPALSRVHNIDYKAIIDHLGPCPGAREDWHVDHIDPLMNYDLTDPAQLQIAFRPENHRWLHKDEHKVKSAEENRFYQSQRSSNA